MEAAAPSRILLVEDDADLRRLFRTALALHGFLVTEAPDGITALHLLDNETPDLLILDIGLPDISGISIQEELAAHAETHDVPILVVTGSTAVLDHLPVRCLLRKPVSPEDLIGEVRRCLTAARGDRDENEVERRRRAGRVLKRAAQRKRHSRAARVVRRPPVPRRAKNR